MFKINYFYQPCNVFKVWRNLDVPTYFLEFKAIVNISN